MYPRDAFLAEILLFSQLMKRFMFVARARNVVEWMLLATIDLATLEDASLLT